MSTATRGYVNCPVCTVGKRADKIAKKHGEQGVTAFMTEGCEAIGERHFGNRDYQESARQREAEASGDPRHTWPGPQWEYRVEMFKNPSAWVQSSFMSPEDMQERLGRFGAFGWELVSVTSTVKTRVDAPNDLILIFKRPVLPEA
jgi:hypothetical protein